MESILFLLPTGVSVRNFLSTGVLDRLGQNGDLKVVAVGPEPVGFHDYVQSTDNLVFEPFPYRPSKTRSNLIHAILRQRFYKIKETPSRKILSKGPLYPKRSELLVESVLRQPLPRSRSIYRWLQGLEARLDVVSPRVQDIYDRYQPSMVVSTHTADTEEIEFLKYARKNGIKTVGIIKSFDVLTTKGYIPVPMDHYLVWNQVMGKELVQLHDVPEDRLAITGIPQFDIYADRSTAPSREEFLSSHGLDPEKKTVLYATCSAGINDEDPLILSRLAEALAEGPSGPVQILARLHQLDSPARYQGITYPNLVFQVPGSQIADRGQWRLLDPRFLTDLRDTLLHCDLVVNTASTMSLDAVAMDKPVVNIAFDVRPRGYYRSCRRYYDFDHYRPIVESRATKIAYGFDQCLSFIRDYLDHPEMDSQERARLKAIMCHKVDGRSGERVVDCLLGLLSTHSPDGPVGRNGSTFNPVADAKDEEAMRPGVQAS